MGAGAGLIVILIGLAGPLCTLGIWLWLRSRRAPIALVEPLDIGRVLSGTFSAFTRWRILLLAIVVIGSLRLVEGLIIQIEVPKLVINAPLPQQTAYGVIFGAAIGFIGAPISLLFYLPALFGLSRTYEGDIDPWHGALRASALAWLPAIGVSVLSFLGSVLGMILFVVPAAILALNWAVVLPVVTLERPGILATLQRSRALATGSRGRILLLFIILVAGTAAMMALVEAVQHLMGVATRVRLLLGVLRGIALSILGAGLHAALYVELRRIRDGLSAPGLAEVFA